MGGGHVTRPDFALAGADPRNPMTEFYLALQQALSRSRGFAAPGLYVKFTPPADTQLYAEDIRDHCALFSAPGPGRLEIFAPYRLQLLYDDLYTLADGTPAALLLTEESSRRTTALQLLPPFTPDGLPPVPECAAQLTLQLTEADLFAIDADPAALGARLAAGTAGKAWVQHPRLEQWLTTALAAAQRAYRRQGGQ